MVFNWILVMSLGAILQTHAKLFIGDCSYGFCEQRCKQVQVDIMECMCYASFSLKTDGRRCLRLLQVDDELSGSGFDASGEAGNCDNEDGDCEKTIRVIGTYSGDDDDDENDTENEVKVIKEKIEINISVNLTLTSSVSKFTSSTEVVFPTERSEDVIGKSFLVTPTADGYVTTYSIQTVTLHRSAYTAIDSSNIVTGENSKASLVTYKTSFSPLSTPVISRKSLLEVSYGNANISSLYTTSTKTPKVVFSNSTASKAVKLVVQDGEMKLVVQDGEMKRVAHVGTSVRDVMEIKVTMTTRGVSNFVHTARAPIPSKNLFPFSSSSPLLTSKVDRVTPSKSKVGVTPSKSKAGVTPSKSKAVVTHTKSKAGVTPSKSKAVVTPRKSKAVVTPRKSKAGVTHSKSKTPNGTVSDELLQKSTSLAANATKIYIVKVGESSKFKETFKISVTALTKSSVNTISTSSVLVAKTMPLGVHSSHLVTTSKSQELTLIQSPLSVRKSLNKTIDYKKRRRKMSTTVEASRSISVSMVKTEPSKAAESLYYKTASSKLSNMVITTSSSGLGRGELEKSSTIKSSPTKQVRETEKVIKHIVVVQNSQGEPTNSCHRVAITYYLLAVSIFLSISLISIS